MCGCGGLSINLCHIVIIKSVFTDCWFAGAHAVSIMKVLPNGNITNIVGSVPYAIVNV